ncbi:hypothetical protein BDV93DRAFT_556898 [Ceratobasidium sp. AG-I]|nr:hypothetical protein BDV93DRAFT_556898 [Ceratobasidium sp. AG-I]
MRPVSPVPSYGSSLDFVKPVPQLWSRIASSILAFGSEDTGPAGSQGRVVDAEEDCRFYAGFFGEDFNRKYDDSLSFSSNGELEGLNHDHEDTKDNNKDDKDVHEEDEPNSMDADAPGPRVEDQDPLIGNDPDPDDPNAEHAAAFRGPSRLTGVTLGSIILGASPPYLPLCEPSPLNPYAGLLPNKPSQSLEPLSQADAGRIAIKCLHPREKRQSPAAHRPL